MDMDSLDNVLNKRLNKLGLNKELQAAYILSQANSLADGRFEAVRFSHGVLTVNCPNSIAAAELQFETQSLIAKINDKIKPAAVKRLAFRVQG